MIFTKETTGSWGGDHTSSNNNKPDNVKLAPSTGTSRAYILARLERDGHACRDGLLPDGVEGAIVPYKSKATWIPMYRGMLELVIYYKFQSNGRSSR